MPFSDPLADGPTIHAAATAALEAGATLETALEICEAISDRVPVVFMVYANMVLAHGGAAEFARRALAAGAAGAIVPDLPLEEAERGADGVRRCGAGAGAAGGADHAGRAAGADLRGGARASSTSSPPWARPGSGTSCRRQLAELVAATKAEAEVPVAVGFGIGTPEQAAQVGGSPTG